MTRGLLLLCVCLTACAAPPPELASRISAEAQAQDFPSLLPLAPFSDIDALLPEDSATTARSLAARAADLRRRARALNALPTT